jgi:hypothetical protein
MKTKPTRSKSAPRTPALAGGAREAESNRYVLRLYVAGQTPKSVHAIANIKKICEENLKGRYVLDVIDLYQQPHWRRANRSSPCQRSLRNSRPRCAASSGICRTPSACWWGWICKRR